MQNQKTANGVWWVLVDLGHRLCELRRQHGFTQEEFADRAEMDVCDLRRIEAGSSNVNVRTLAGLAHALGEPVFELLRPPSARSSRRPGRPKKTNIAR